MPTQLLATRLAVTNLAAGATTSIPHGLKSGGKGVTPTLIVCDRSSSVAVTGYDTLVVTFTNVGDVMASANFRVEHDHSIYAIGTPTVAWQGWDGTAIPSGPAGGDLLGTYPNPTVGGIQGYGISNTMPANGDALLFNSALNVWEHAPIIFSGGPPTGPASRDLGGNYPDPLVVGLQNALLPSPSVADGFLKRNAANTGWEEIAYGAAANTVCVGNDARLSNARTPTGAAGGDLSGTYPNPSIAALAVTDAKVATANKDGLASVASMRTLGTGAQQACAGNDARLSDARVPTGTAGGDLAGTYPNPTVDGLQGRPIDSVAPAVGDVYSWDGAKWTPVDINSLILEVTLISGSFSDSSPQNLPVKPATLAVKYNTVEIAGGVTVANNGLGQPTRLTVPTDGIYSFDISPQLRNTGGGGSTITFWAAVDGTPVPRSASSLEMGNNNNRTLPFLTLNLPMNAGQYLEWFFTATGSNTSLQFFPVDGVIPAIPSVIANVTRVSAIP